MGELLRIPGVGKKTEQDLLHIGYPTVASLRGADPERMYERDCAKRGVIIDRCQLYVYRCAVYFASEPSPDPGKCKWWNWKDKAGEDEGNHSRQ